MTQMPQDRPAGFENVEVDSLADDAVMLDVREDDEWAAGHAPNAVHIPLSELPARLGDIPDDSAGPIPVVCRSGGRSARAALWLGQQGFEAVNVAGGMKRWAAQGKQVVADGGEPHII